MRLALLLLPVPLLIGAAPPEEPQDTAPLSAMPGYQRPAPLASGDLKDFVQRTTCRDKIEYTRDASG